MVSLTFLHRQLCFSIERGFNVVAVEMMLWIVLKQREELSEMMMWVVFETDNNSRLDDVENHLFKHLYFNSQLWSRVTWIWHALCFWVCMKGNLLLLDLSKARNGLSCPNSVLFLEHCLLLPHFTIPPPSFPTPHHLLHVYHMLAF